MLYEAVIKVVVEAESQADACDAISEALRPVLRTYAGEQSSFIDWLYVTAPMTPPMYPQEYEFVNPPQFQASS